MEHILRSYLTLLGGGSFMKHLTEQGTVEVGMEGSRAEKSSSSGKK